MLELSSKFGRRRELRSVHMITHLISCHLISSNPGAPWNDPVCRGCDQSERRRPRRVVRLLSATANWVASRRAQFRWNQVTRDEVGWDEMRDMNAAACCIAIDLTQHKTVSYSRRPEIHGCLPVMVREKDRSIIGELLIIQRAEHRAGCCCCCCWAGALLAPPSLGHWGKRSPKGAGHPKKNCRLYVQMRSFWHKNQRIGQITIFYPRSPVALYENFVWGNWGPDRWLGCPCPLCPHAPLEPPLLLRLVIGLASFFCGDNPLIEHDVILSDHRMLLD